MVENGISNTNFCLALVKEKIRESDEKMSLVIQGLYFNMT